jgi:hypothetical protein
LETSEVDSHEKTMKRRKAAELILDELTAVSKIQTWSVELQHGALDGSCQGRKMQESV